MDEKTLDKISHQIVYVCTLIWSIFLIPIIIMLILISHGYSSLPTTSVVVANILYYNLLLFPIILILSSTFSWLSLKKKRYKIAIALILIPFINILIEFIAADLALYLS